MRSKSALKKLGPLLTEPSFTSKDAALKKVDSATLGHYVKTGQLERLGRGIYRGLNAKVTTEFKWEDLVEKALKIKHGVICLISALAIYEITDEIPRKFWIAIKNSTDHQADHQTKIVRMKNLELGKTTIDIGGVMVPIFDRERTIIDSFRLLDHEVAIKALKFAIERKGKEKIDLIKLQKYAKVLRVNITPYLMVLTI